MRIALGAALLAAACPAAGNVAPEDLLETVDIGNLAVSPDGRWLAFRTDQAQAAGNRYQLSWYVVPTDGAAPPRRIGDGGSPLFSDAGAIRPEPPTWEPGSQSFVFRALVGGSVGLWRSSVNSSRALPLMHDAADVHAFAIDPATGRVDYTVGASRAAIAAAEERDYADGVLVDATVDLAQGVYRGAIVNGRHATQRFAGSWFAREGLLAATPMRTLTIGGPPGSVAGTSSGKPDVLRSVTGSTAALAKEGGGRCVAVARGAAKPVAARCFAYRVVAMVWWPGTDDLLVTLQDRNFAQSLVTWSIGDDEVRSLVRGSGLLAGSAEPTRPCALTSNAAFCVAAAAGAPPRLVRIDRRAGRAKTVFAPNAALMRGFMGRVRLLVWRDAHGNAFTGELFLPASRSPAPLFITYYACRGFVRGGVGDEWPLVSFADSGIAALCINKPPDPDPKLAQPSYDLALSGVSVIIDHLARTGRIDRARVGMGGLSFGSEVTMWAAMNSRLLSAVSIASLQLEPSYYWMNGIAGRENHAQLAATWGLGAPNETPEQWRIMSPALNVDRLLAPILLQLPEQEARTTIELYARLTHSVTPAELYAFPDEPHILTQPAHRLAAYRRNLDWFRYWLQGRKDPAPTKVAQYRRWQAMADRQRSAQARQEAAQSSIPSMSNNR